MEHSSKASERRRYRRQSHAGRKENEKRDCQGEKGRENLLKKEEEEKKKTFLLGRRKTTMETQSDENQDQRQDKRGTNEHLQRASSVLFIAVFAGALTFSSMLGFVSAFALWGILKF